MPCKCPNEHNPLQCDKKVAKGVEAPEGKDHVWPAEGHLFIERCEIYCWYCWEKKGATRTWKFPWYLRRHVQSMHAGRSHPNLTCSNGWKESATGNRKPWREEGHTPPMGRKAETAPNTPQVQMALTPKAASAPGTMPTPKTTQSTDRKEKRRALKKKHTEADNNATATDTTSPPALTVDTSFTMPAGQLTLPDGLVLPPQVFGMAQATGFDGAEPDEGNSMTMVRDNSMMMMRKNNMTMMPGNSMTASFSTDTDTAPMFSSNSTTLFEDFENAFGELCGTSDFDYGGLETAFGGTSNGLDLQGSSMTAANYSSFDSSNGQSQLSLTNSTGPDATGSQSGVRSPTWTQRQFCRTDGTAIDPKTPTGEAADSLMSDLNQSLFVRLAKGEIDEEQALHVLQRFTKNFQEGKEL